jgi:RNA polymerase sigma-70 factor (ECF subfamily)
VDDADLSVMQALQAGDDSALNELISRHREPLHRFVYRYMRDEVAARDIVQETFVRVYFKAGKYEPGSTVKTWIYAIAMNLCRDQFRRMARHRGDLSFDDSSDRLRACVEPVDPSPGPNAQAVQGDQFAQLQQAIDRLPHPLKAALVLSALEGRTQKETAEILGTTPKTVELRVYHAKEKLRKILCAFLGKEARPG